MFVRSDIAKKQASFSARPDFMAASVAEIDFEFLRSQGIKACFIDLDGTVVERGQYAVSAAIIKRVRDQRLPVYIATNRPRSRELKNLKDDLSAVAVIHPSGLRGKPFRRYFNNALKEHDLAANQVVMIGDRYIQDVVGANRAGIYSLVVNKIGRPVGRFDAALSSFEARLTRRFAGKYRQV